MVCDKCGTEHKGSSAEMWLQCRDALAAQLAESQRAHNMAVVDAAAQASNAGALGDLLAESQARAEKLRAALVEVVAAGHENGNICNVEMGHAATAECDCVVSLVEAALAADQPEET